MADNVAIRRLPTGVPGLDQVLGGGLPEFSFNLIAGAPGAGKTTLAQQIMFALSAPERPALYFTVVGEPPVKMLRYQQYFSFFDVARINESIRYANGAGTWSAASWNSCLDPRCPSMLINKGFREGGRLRPTTSRTKSVCDDETAAENERSPD